jgi:hypothetical protein
LGWFDILSGRGRCLLAGLFIGYWNFVALAMVNRAISMAGSRCNLTEEMAWDRRT